jgi:hypothetical protein
VETTNSYCTVKIPRLDAIERTRSGECKKNGIAGLADCSLSFFYVVSSLNVDSVSGRVYDTEAYFSLLGDQSKNKYYNVNVNAMCIELFVGDAASFISNPNLIKQNQPKAVHIIVKR